MKWLITGGAGYIGAHVTRDLQEGGEEAVVLDDLSTGYLQRVSEVPTEQANLLNEDAVSRVMSKHKIEGVIHLAAKKQPGVSVKNPLLYYRENVGGLVSILSAMASSDVRALIFSSSAAVYGEHDSGPLTEESQCKPINPYGETKLMGERIIADAARAHGIHYVNLRYFTVAGAASRDLADVNSLNLLPMVFARLEQGVHPEIFGGDYPTPDGTTIRDYIHVSDVASAHTAAARAICDRLRADDEKAIALTLNVGTGHGWSTRQVMSTILQVSGRSNLRPSVVERRPGDPAIVVASAAKIREVLGWTAKYDLEAIVKSAWGGWMHRKAG